MFTPTLSVFTKFLMGHRLFRFLMSAQSRKDKKNYKMEDFMFRPSAIEVEIYRRHISALVGDKMCQPREVNKLRVEA